MSHGPTRRDFLAAAASTAVASAAAPLFAQAGPQPAATTRPAGGRYRPPRLGLGCVAIGTGFAPVTAEQSDAVMRAAWAAGVRYFDTSPFYGFGLSERRVGHVLAEHPRDAFVVSTKIGRLFEPTREPPQGMWKRPSPFKFRYDYTADGTRRSVEDSLQRLGLSHLDVVFIHDLSPDNADMGERWTEQMDVAIKGAMPALTKMRDEGMIKGWGMGVNRIEPCLRAIEAADPDVMLQACQYSIVHHEDALARLLPVCEQRGVSIVVGAPLNAGFLAGKPRYNYGPEMPADLVAKRDRIAALAKQHGTDLRTAALQFSAAPAAVASVIPGASTPGQVIENAISMSARVAPEFWQALKRERLIAANAPTPA